MPKTSGEQFNKGVPVFSLSPKLKNHHPLSEQFWNVVVLFTPVLEKGVNDKIGPKRPKLRFNFRRCPVGAGHD